MSTSYSWEGTGMYGSFQLWIECASVQVKLWDPLRTRAIPEHFWGDGSRRGAISSVRTFPLTKQSLFLRLAAVVGIGCNVSELAINILGDTATVLILGANMTNTFKIRLDKFWWNQEIMYNFWAQLEGTGSRSEI